MICNRTAKCRAFVVMPQQPIDSSVTACTFAPSRRPAMDGPVCWLKSSLSARSKKDSCRISASFLPIPTPAPAPPTPAPIPPKPAPPGAKSILFIVVDDLRPALRGAYGAPTVTPNLDALARNATVFHNAYCQYAYCAPSR